jgi:hypothetical protein
MSLFLSQGAAKSRNSGAPETFIANAQGKGGGGASAATLQNHMERYTPESDRMAVEAALKQGGYQAFVPALRKAPEVGRVAVGDRTFLVRWVREQKPRTDG